MIKALAQDFLNLYKDIFLIPNLKFQVKEKDWKNIDSACLNKFYKILPDDQLMLIITKISYYVA